jgi:hypothetical protein
VHDEFPPICIRCQKIVSDPSRSSSNRLVRGRREFAPAFEVPTDEPGLERRPEELQMTFR